MVSAVVSQGVEYAVAVTRVFAVAVALGGEAVFIFKSSDKTVEQPFGQIADRGCVYKKAMSIFAVVKNIVTDSFFEIDVVARHELR
jgi:hypothetical protein